MSRHPARRSRCLARPCIGLPCPLGRQSARPGRYLARHSAVLQPDSRRPRRASVNLRVHSQAPAVALAAGAPVFRRDCCRGPGSDPAQPSKRQLRRRLPQPGKGWGCASALRRPVLVACGPLRDDAVRTIQTQTPGSTSDPGALRDDCSPAPLDVSCQRPQSLSTAPNPTQGPSVRTGTGVSATCKGVTVVN
jgi:hypothetical protein